MLCRSSHQYVILRITGAGQHCLQVSIMPSDGQLEDGFEKVAIYEAEGLGFMHVAIQLSDGRWTSKLGQDEYIEHNSPEGLASEDYGRPTKFLKRAKSTRPSSIM